MIEHHITLKDMQMEPSDRTEIMMAIGNHDESTGTPVSDISAALILADKSDAHRSRVSKKDRGFCTHFNSAY